MGQPGSVCIFFSDGSRASTIVYGDTMLALCRCFELRSESEPAKRDAFAKAWLENESPEPNGPEWSRSVGLAPSGHGLTMIDVGRQRIWTVNGHGDPNSFLPNLDGALMQPFAEAGVLVEEPGSRVGRVVIRDTWGWDVRRFGDRNGEMMSHRIDRLARELMSSNDYRLSGRELKQWMDWGRSEDNDVYTQIALLTVLQEWLSRQPFGFSIIARSGDTNGVAPHTCLSSDGGSRP